MSSSIVTYTYRSCKNATISSVLTEVALIIADEIFRAAFLNEYKIAFTNSNEYKDMKKLEKLINLKDNQFLAHSTQTIFLFKYSIKENKAEINLLYYYEYSLTPTKNVSYKFLNDIVDIVPIIKDKKEIIALCMKSYIHFLNLPNFDLIILFKNH